MQAGNVLDATATVAADPRAAAAAAAAKRMQDAQDASPAVQHTSMSERARLEDAREKLNKLLVSSIMDYRSNSVPAAAACISVLTTLVSNVLQEPANDKMRQVKTSTKLFAGQVASVSGGEKFLVEAGWYRRTELHVAHYIYGHQPDSFQWSVLEIALDELKKAGSHANDKAERAAASAVSSNKKAEDTLERERIKLQIKGDKATRMGKFVYG